MRIRIVFAFAVAVATTVAMAHITSAAEPTKAGPEPAVPSGTPDRSAQSASPERAAPPGGPSEGIGVHGHWVIEVRNPDGTVTARREFRNGLTADGQVLLSRYLAHLLTPGLWNIRLGGTPSPCASAAANLDCFITEARAASRPSAPNISKNLMLANRPLRLNGSIVVPATGSITTVATGSDSCAPNIRPDVCLGNTLSSPASTVFPPSFTGTTITAIPVTAGQQITVAVTITFSTAP